MRVITGKARGRILETLKGDDVRPTTDKVKEAVFSAIQFEIEGRHFLDLFAGSGQMGIEALSRGAAHTTFIDKSKLATKVIERNLTVTNLKQSARVYTTDSVEFIRNTSEEFDIIYVDPPYGK